MATDGTSVVLLCSGQFLVSRETTLQIGILRLRSSSVSGMSTLFDLSLVVKVGCVSLVGRMSSMIV